MIRNHPHPGEVLRELVFEPLGMPVTQAAEHFGMSRLALSRVLNGRAGISPDLAIRLELAGASTARFWLELQTHDDLWCARQHPQPRIERLPSAAQSA